MPLSDLSIVNAVWGVLTSDAAFLDFFGLVPSSPVSQKIAKIQQEMEPNGLSVDNIPLACIYPVPGVRSKVNDLVYDAMFEVAIYSNSSTGVKSATTKAGVLRIGERARKLLHYIQLSGATLPVEFQTSFTDTSGVSGIKKHVLRFKVGEQIQ